MKSQTIWPIRIAIFTAYALGSILLSQSISFARWDEFHPSKYFVNFHAVLLFSSGMSIVALSGGIAFLNRRIAELDRRVSDLTRTGIV